MRLNLQIIIITPNYSPWSKIGPVAVWVGYGYWHIGNQSSHAEGDLGDFICKTMKGELPPKVMIIISNKNHKAQMNG